MKAHVLRSREAALEPHPQQHSEYLDHVKQPENDQYIDELLYVKGIGNTNSFQCSPWSVALFYLLVIVLLLLVKRFISDAGL